MKTQHILMASWALMGLVLPGAARGGGGGFTPGHVFVSVHEADPCDFGGLEAIIEIDPATGAASIFADSDDGICAVSGLRFTPDGERMLALSAGHIVPENDNGWVHEFAPDGTGTVILDQSDGLARPFGANALAFDSAGNLYVLSTLTSTILKFSVDGGPGTVFADGGDGIVGRGALDFAPNGDLFYCGDLAGVIIRITPDGESSVFDDTVLYPTSLALDTLGNLFVSGSSLQGRTIYRYEGGDPNSRSGLDAGDIGEWKGLLRLARRNGHGPPASPILVEDKGGGRRGDTRPIRPPPPTHRDLRPSLREDVLCVRKGFFGFFIDSLLKALHKPFRALAVLMPPALNYAFCTDISPMAQLPCLS